MKAKFVNYLALLISISALAVAITKKPSQSEIATEVQKALTQREQQIVEKYAPLVHRMRADVDQPAKEINTFIDLLDGVASVFDLAGILPENASEKR